MRRALEGEVGGSMSPKLTKRRDELAWKHRDEVFEVNPNGYLVEPGLNEPDTHFSEGFDACHAEMLPMLEQMAEALRVVAAKWDTNETTKVMQVLEECVRREKVAEAALAAYQAWMSE